MLLSKEQVKAYLPHKDPFLFIDTIEKVIPSKTILTRSENCQATPRDLVGTSVHANFKVSEDMFILQGHFPGNPILPGVIQVEMMAQASAFVSLAMNQNPESQKSLKVKTLLLSVEKSKFRLPITPPSQLKIIATMTRCRGTIATYESLVFDEGERRVSEASFMAKLELQ